MCLLCLYRFSELLEAVLGDFLFNGRCDIYVKPVRVLQTSHRPLKRISPKTAFRSLEGGLAATFDLAGFGLYMIAPAKKSVNHSKTLTSMREVQRSLARTSARSTREYMCFLCVVTRLWKRSSLFVIVYLLLAFLATVQSSSTTFL